MTISAPNPALMRGAPAGQAPEAGPGGRADPLSLLRYLSSNDRLIVSMLAEHQVLTTQQICDLAFSGLDTAQRRLLSLVRRQVLDRFRWRVPVGSQPWHYTLGVAGTALAAAERGTEPPRPAQLQQRCLRLATSPRLAHLVGVNGFFCSLARHARQHPGSGLDAWWSERRCGEVYGEVVRPDAYGVWSEGERSVEFFLEHDTGSEPLSRVAAKLDAYAELALAGGPRHPVLIWLATAAREANLQQRLAEHRPPHPVATASRELAEARGISPAGALWLVPGSPRRERLVGLGPAER